ncbi:MAG: HAMP domain-containing protein, partial [Candidatus Eisenbacteria bacterium]|nr:HAMP domain-containing protein [Candidatus Eisenbacteria bacterium]
MGGVATLFSLLLARSVARPVEELTAAALRIGHGDFASPLPRGGGREVAALAGAMEAMRDGTQRLLAELRRGQAGAEAILAGITEGVFSVGRARRIRYLNPQAAALLGVTPEQALGCFCGDVLNPEGPGGGRPCEESCPILHARFRGGARKVEHLRLPDGSRRTVLITSSPPGPAAEDGVAVQFQVLRDETEIEAPRRLRDNVLANISHEFRTPLSAQLASLELLRDRLPELSIDELRALVLSIERGTLRLTRLVDNLLESTRIEAGQDALRRRPVALDEVVEEAVGLMAPLFEQRHQALEVDLPYPLPGVIADGPRLVQVFVNLLANAQKFAPEGSEVRIGGAVGEREIRLWVEDQGPGLPDGAGETIFQRYSRSSGEEPEESGMGLGLFIVKSIIDRHGGRVEARGGATGTRVTVALPRESAGERTAPPTVERGLANEAGGQEPS